MSVSRLASGSRRALLRLCTTSAALAATAPLAFGSGGAASNLLTRWADGWSTLGEPQKLLALVSAGVVYEDVAAGDVVRGVDAFGSLLAAAAKAIPDFRVELFDGFATEGMAAAEYAITGTQTGDLPYLKATGKSFRLRASSVFVLEDEKITRESRYYDMARFLTQLGALAPADLPPLGTPADKPGGGS